jgi:hypothetical protein
MKSPVTERLCFSPPPSVFGTGDWAVVIAGLKPHPAWRIGLGLVGVTSYVVVICLAAREFTQLACSGLLAPGEVGRLIYVAYLAGGVLLVSGAAMNPISSG